MNNLYYKYFAVLVLLVCAAGYTAKGQNSTFSQYHLTPVYNSPGDLATSDYFQVLGHYRKQSLSQDQGYQNYALSALYPLYYKNGGRRFGGIGLGIMSENSGMMGMLKESSVKAGYAYNWQVTTSQHVSIGLQGGYHRRNIHLNSIQTQSQYQNGVYVPGLPLGENFSNNVSQAFKADVGATWYKLDEFGDQKFSLGITAFNVNRPDYSFLESTQEQAVPLRYQLHGSIRAFATERLHIAPTFRYMKERNYDQLNLGSLFLYQLEEGVSAMHESHLGVGVWYSKDNAAVISLELVKPTYVMAISYDLPASGKMEKMQVNNGVEVTFGWRLNRGKGRKQLQRKSSEMGAAEEVKQPVVVPIEQQKKQPVVEKPEAPQPEQIVEVQKTPEPATIERKGLHEIATTKYKLSPVEIKALENKVEFTVGSAELSPDAKSEVARIVQVMQEHPALEVKIVGHTCTLGTEKLNKRLSLDRAEAAKKDLVSKGIDPGRIQTEGRNYQEPIASNETEAGRIQNRRVEFIIVE